MEYKKGDRVRICQSRCILPEYWYLYGVVQDSDVVRKMYRIKPTGLDDPPEIWVHFVDLEFVDDEKPADYADPERPETERESGRVLTDKVREDPPVAVPGFIAVTASPASFMVAFGPEKRVRKLIDIRDILCVIEQDDDRAMIVRRSDTDKAPLVPPLVTVEDFDEVSRRMKAARRSDNERE